MAGTWTYNTNNELESYGSNSFVYDDNGNMTRKTSGGQETNYIYDIEDRLIRVEDDQGGVIADYYYDPFGRRLWKEVDGTRTYFIYSDEGLIGEYDSSGNEIKTYGWAPDSLWGTDPLFQKIGTQYFWYQNDHQGTPQKLTATNGLVVWSAVYDSFGNCQVEIDGIENNLRFAGQYYDAEIGLHYNWLRYYDPDTGRYLRTDPLCSALNLYVYVFNNPHNEIDPFGLCAISVRTGSIIDWEREFPWLSDPMGILNSLSRALTGTSISEIDPRLLNIMISVGEPLGNNLIMDVFLKGIGSVKGLKFLKRWIIPSVDTYEKTNTLHKILKNIEDPNNTKLKEFKEFLKQFEPDTRVRNYDPHQFLILA